jgi:tetratricopeptide (TPR) repeat protein
MKPEDKIIIDDKPVNLLEAVQMCNKLAADAQANGDISGAGASFLNAANLLLRADFDDQAQVSVMRAEARAREALDFELLASCLGVKAKLLSRAKRYQAALEALREAENLDRENQSTKIEMTLEQQFAILEELSDVEGMCLTAEKFFAVATDAEAIWRMRRHLAHFGIAAGENAAAEHPYDLGAAIGDHVSQVDGQRAALVKQLVDQASEMQNKCDLAGALSCATQATAVPGCGARVWKMRAMLELRLNRVDECTRSINRALALDDRDPQAWWFKGHLLSHTRHYEEEIVCCDRALTLKPDYVEALSMKAAALIALARYMEAAECCKAALMIRGDLASVHMNMAAAMMGLKHYDVASRAFNAAARLGEPRAHQGAAACAQLAREGR